MRVFVKFNVLYKYYSCESRKNERNGGGKTQAHKKKSTIQHKSLRFAKTKAMRCNDTQTLS